MTFRVTILGSSGSYASGENPCSGYLVRSDGASVLLDAGPGTLGPLQREIDLGELDAIVLTHAHPDHWLELPVLRNVFLYFVRRTIPVFGTAETAQLNSNITIGEKTPFVWTTINPTSDVTIGDQRWRFGLADHPVETLGPRVDCGDRSFVFTADSGPGWDYAAVDGIDDPIDVALSDASHLQVHEDRGIPHMSARQAAVRAREAGVRRLILTHLVPGSDPDAHRAEAEAAYGGPVEVALPGLTFTI
ncbi:MAG: MBL fold metallo-hydrolase [Acidimicrobiales bacterium]